MFRGARSRAVMALLAIVAGLAIAACGSSSSSSGSGSSGGSSASAGGSSGSSTTGGTGTTTGGRGGFAQLTAAQRSCLKSHGVTLPTGGLHRRGASATRPTGAPGAGTPTTGAPGGYSGAAGGGRGFFGASNLKFATAAKACGVSFGTGRFGSGTGTGAGAKLSSTTIKSFVACVDKHGYTLTDVNTSGSGSVLPKRLESSQKFLAAARQCYAYLRPTGPGANGGPGATGSGGSGAASPAGPGVSSNS